VSIPREQTWVEYAFALPVQRAGMLVTYLIQRLQHVALQPAGVSCRTVSPSRLLRFATNTNWQSYAGEATMSHSRRWLTRLA
jgi:K+-transporting ATPase ATPase A chain